jgi:hypothetical protein
MELKLVTLIQIAKGLGELATEGAAQGFDRQEEPA